MPAISGLGRCIEVLGVMLFMSSGYTSFAEMLLVPLAQPLLAQQTFP